MDDRGAPKPKKTSVLGTIALVIVFARIVDRSRRVRGAKLDLDRRPAAARGRLFRHDDRRSLLADDRVRLDDALVLFEPAWLRRKGVAGYARQQRPRAAMSTWLR